MKRRPLRDAPAVARPAAAPAPPKQPAMAPKPRAHCGGAIELPPQHALYWRCGACRKVNGRPAYARGFRAGCANCGVCAFYASRITHGPHGVRGRFERLQENIEETATNQC